VFSLSSDERKLLLFALLVGVAARWNSLSLGYSVDDYGYFATNASYGGFSERALLSSDGRFGMAWLGEILVFIGISFPQAMALGSLLLSAALAWLAVLTSRLSGFAPRTAFTYIAIVVISCFPYQAEYFSFKEGGGVYSFAFFLVGIGLAIRGRSLRSIAGSSACLFLSLTMYQTGLFIFLTVVAMGFCVRFAVSEEPSMLVRLRDALRAVQLPQRLAVAVASLALYYLVAKITWISGVQPNVRTALIGLGDLSARTVQIVRLAGTILWKQEPIITSGWKASVLGLFLVALTVCLIRSKLRAAHLISFTILPLLLSGMVLAPTLPLKTWWPVPRSLPQVSWLWAYVIYVSGHVLGRFARPLLPIAVAISVVLSLALVSMNNRVLGDQQRLNIRDRELANRIVGRMEMMPGFASVTHVRIVGGTWGYPNPIQTLDGDLNMSAFFPEFSKLPLLNEISGYNFTSTYSAAERAKQDAVCRANAKWPDMASIQITGDTALVCFPEQK
jgi:hypothetical protein